MTPEDREELVSYLPAMRAFAITLTRNRAGADDAVQDAMLKALTYFHQYQAGTNMRAWLFTILRNTYYSSKRKYHREHTDDDGRLLDTQVVKPDHDGFLHFRDFLRSFDKLPPEQREVLILVGASGFSYEETAKMTGVPLGTVKSRIMRARARLVRELELGDGQIELTDKVTLAILNRNR